MAEGIKVFRKVFAPRCAITILRLGKDFPRVCDYCNTTLVAPGGIVVEPAFLTDYGLMCCVCLGEIPAIECYKPGEDVSSTGWYKGYYLRGGR